MKKGLIVSIILMLPMSVFGSTELIYTWGYGESFYEALQALKGFTSEADYLVKMALAIAVFVFSIGKALDSKSSPVFEIGKLFMLYGVVYYFFLSPSNNTYIIHDEVTSKDYKVSKLPMGIGNTVSLMSRLEKTILDGMEKHYSTPNSISYSKAGLGFSLNAMMDIPTLRVSEFDRELQINMDYYVRNCFQHNMGTKIPYNSLNKNSDLLNVVLIENDGKLGYFTKNGVSKIMSCGKIAKEIKTAFIAVVGNASNKVASKNAISTAINQVEYLNKFQAASSLYFRQAAGAREQFQQIMLMNSLDDGIINTAKMLGLNPQSFAANTAIADQTITASMQAQGRLAQTYLPLAKAYMTIIVVSVSWLMAIISIIFGSYTHIKMFFTLCLTMVLWTPILSLINFLNDLNIQKSFELVNANDAAFTYANYKDVIQKITANSNFLSYLIMLTPMLAFALAKGSEMGFVSIASSLSQQLAGGARAAGSFATQQALSTSTAISSTDGSVVSSLTAGKREDVWAESVGGSVVSLSNSGTTNGMLNQTTNTAGGSKGVDNDLGLTISANTAGLNAGWINTNLKSAGTNLTNAQMEYLKTEEGQKFVSDHLASNGVSSSMGRTLEGTDTTTINKGAGSSKGKNEENFDTYSAGAAVNLKLGSGKGGEGDESGEGGKGKNFININAGGSAGHKETNTTSSNISENITNNVSINEKQAATLLNNKEFRAAFQNHIENSETEGAEKVKQAQQAYNELASFGQNIGGDAQAMMVQNYKDTHNATTAEALTYFESAVARGDVGVLTKYANMQNNQDINSDGLETPRYKSRLDYNAIADIYGRNSANVDFQGQREIINNGDGTYTTITGAALQNSETNGATVAGNFLKNTPLTMKSPMEKAKLDATKANVAQNYMGIDRY